MVCNVCVDIDTIEIRSDDDTEEAGGIKTRRVYHYRVRGSHSVHLESDDGCCFYYASSCQGKFFRGSKPMVREIEGGRTLELKYIN